MPQSSDRSVFRWLWHASHRRVPMVLVVGLLGFLSGVLMAWAKGVPLPVGHDEFAYLLAADTLASGRLANPTPEFWPHFETFHVIQRPTYAAKFPPGQGLFLALGKVLFGHPVVGVWLSMGLAAAAITWMLQAWLRPPWALAGGLLAVAQMGFLGGLTLPDPPVGSPGYWAWSYWGAAVPAAGGALLFGGWRRVLHRPNALPATLMGLGLGLLAITRPFEGFLAGLPAGFVMLVHLFRAPWPWRDKLWRIVFPTALSLGAWLGWLGYYNAAVTGSPWKLPYQVHEETYAMTPLFVFLHEQPPPPHRHAPLIAFHLQWAKKVFDFHGTWEGWKANAVHKITSLTSFYIGLPLALPWLAMPWGWRFRWVRFALFTVGFVLAGIFLLVWTLPHYFAPIMALMAYLNIQAVRMFRVVLGRPGRRIGTAYLHVLPVVYLTLVAMRLILPEPEPANSWFRQRADIERQLLAKPGKHLVIVRYAADHSPGQEWVYNRADLENAKILWARELSEPENERLIEHHRDRTVWIVHADAMPPVLQPRTPMDP